MGVRLSLTAPICPYGGTEYTAVLETAAVRIGGAIPSTGTNFRHVVEQYTRESQKLVAEMPCGGRTRRADHFPAMDGMSRHGALKTRCRKRRPGASPGCGTILRLWLEQ